MIDLTNPESKAGAVAALELLLKAKVTPIKKISDPGESKKKTNLSKLKMPKNTEELEDDVDETEDEDAKTETEEEKKDRLDRIQNELTGEKGQELAKELKQEQDFKKAKAAQAKQRELDAIKAKAKAHGTFENINAFAADLKKAIGRQISTKQHVQDTFNKPNASFAGTKYLLPTATVLRKQNKPIINVYFDVSGSVPDSGLQKAEKALAGLSVYKDRGLCDFKIYYFSDNVAADRDEAVGATGAFNGEIQAHIKQTKADNVIIITDNDFERQTDFNNIDQMKVKGVVWWFWHRGSRSPSAFEYLQGKQGTLQYKF